MHQHRQLLELEADASAGSTATEGKSPTSILAEDDVDGEDLPPIPSPLSSSGNGGLVMGPRALSLRRSTSVSHALSSFGPPGMIRTVQALMLLRSGTSR